jgi:hypothetical protein
MKHLKPALVMVIILASFVLTRLGETATYEWSDDAGVVHFTDDKGTIPGKFLKRVKELNIDINDNVKPPAAAPAPKSAPPEAAPAARGTKVYGGHGEGYWRSRFADLRKEIKGLEESLPEMKEQEIALNRKRIIYGRASDRVARENLVQSKARVEERIKVLQEALKALDNEASQADVPLEWRQ